MKKSYTYVTLKGQDNYYIAIVPELPGVVAQASSTQELLPRLQEAITAYIQTLEREKLDTPDSLEMVGVGQVEVGHE